MTNEEMNSRIAELLGWKFVKSAQEQIDPSSWYKNGKEIWGRDFSPCTDIRAAWVAVDTLLTDGFQIFKTGPSWTACINTGEVDHITHEHRRISATCFTACKSIAKLVCNLYAGCDMGTVQ